MKTEKEKDVLAFQNVEKEYAMGKRKLKVLQGVSFSVKKGDFVSIMGPSGSGKSTLLHLMGCLDKPTAGKVLVEGEDTTYFSSNKLAQLRSNKIGFVFQAFNLMPNLTALQNVEISMSIREVPRAERFNRARKLLSMVGLSERESHKPNELSGGEKQRVALARAIANNPSFLLADEPTGNLDSKSGYEIMEIIKGLWAKQHATVVMVTHEPAVAAYSKRLIRLLDGEVEADGPTSKLLRKEELKLK